MNDLSALLDRAAGPSVAPVDAHADLARGRRALSRTRRRRGAVGLAGVAAAGVVGVGIEGLSGRGDVAIDRTRVADSTSTSPDPTLMPDPTPPAPDVTAGPYTFPAIPDGWEVQGFRAQEVTIARVGDPDQEPLSFLGKLVILYDQEAPTGKPQQQDGRTFWVNGAGGDDTVAISTRTGSDEPPGTVRIQYPTSSGWTVDQMITFLGGVHVGPDAQPGLG